VVRTEEPGPLVRKGTPCSGARNIGEIVETPEQSGAFRIGRSGQCGPWALLPILGEEPCVEAALEIPLSGCERQLGREQLAKTTKMMRKHVGVDQHAAIAIALVEVEEPGVVMLPDAVAVGGVSQKNLGTNPLHRVGNLPGETVDQNETDPFDAAIPEIQQQRCAGVLETPDRPLAGAVLGELASLRQEVAQPLRIRSVILQPAPIDVSLSVPGEQGAEHTTVKLDDVGVLVIPAHVGRIRRNQPSPHVDAQGREHSPDHRRPGPVHAGHDDGPSLACFVRRGLRHVIHTRGTCERAGAPACGNPRPPRQ